MANRVEVSAGPIRIGGEQLRIGLALLAVYLIWGGTYLAVKIAIHSVPPFLMLGIRFLLAGGLLFGLERLRGAPMPTRAEWGGAAVVGGLLLTLGMGGTAFSQLWVSSSLAALGVAVTPVWAALLGGILGRWPSGSDWLGLALGFVGVILLNIQGELQANPLGALALFIASISWAFGSVLSTRLPQPRGLINTATQMLIGGAGLLLIGLLTGQRIVWPPSLDSVLAFLYLVIFGSLIAFSAYGFLLRNVRPALATSPAYVNPVVAVALGVGLAGEHVTSLTLVAMVVIIAGVVILALGREQ